MNIFTEGVNLVVVNNKEECEGLKLAFKNYEINSNPLYMEMLDLFEFDYHEVISHPNPYNIPHEIYVIIINHTAYDFIRERRGEWLKLFTNVLEFLDGCKVKYSKHRGATAHLIFRIDENYDITNDRLEFTKRTVSVKSESNIVTRAASDNRLFETRNVISYTPTSRIIKLSACNVCIKCGKINNEHDTINIEVPLNYKPHNLLIKTDYNKCDECSGDLISCDPMIAEAIVKFNEMGYKTFSCCSGHVQNAIGAVSLTESEFGRGISPTYVVFKNLNSKQKRKMINTAIDHELPIYFFECEVKFEKDYYYGNNFVVSTNCPQSTYKYLHYACYELLNSELKSFLYSTNINVENEEQGNVQIREYCDILNQLASSVTKIKDKGYNIVDAKTRIKHQKSCN